MKITELAPGDCIRNKNPYPGEGERMFTGERSGETNWKFIQVCSGTLNGTIQIMCESDLIHYEKVK